MQGKDCILRRSSWGKTKTTKEMQIKTLEKLKPLTLTIIANLNHSPTPGQININLTLKAYLSQFLLCDISYHAFNKTL